MLNDPALPRDRLIYLIVEPSSGGKTALRFSLKPPALNDPKSPVQAAFRLRGQIMDGMVLDVDLVSDIGEMDLPQGPVGSAGPAGRDGLNGKDGQPGKDGAAGAAGKDGLNGKDGVNGAPGRDGVNCTNGKDGAPGSAGSAGKDGAPGAAGANGKDGVAGPQGPAAASILGNVTISQTATVIIQAGVRRLDVTIPSSLGVAKGDPLMLLPTAALGGYALHDVVAVSPTLLSVGLSGPLLAVGAGFSIVAKLARLNF